MELEVTTLQATYRVVRPFRLPFHPGSMVRGLFGRALHEAGCARTPRCTGDCEGGNACAYGRIFEPRLEGDPPHRVMRGDRVLPAPWIPVLPPPAQRTLHEGATWRFTLRLFGPLAGGDFGVVLAALEGLARLPFGRDEGRVELLGVRILGNRQEPLRLVEEEAADAVELRCTTPFIWERDKRLVMEPTFPLLFAAIHRRLVKLVASHGRLTEDDEARFEELRHLSAEVRCTGADLRPVDWEREATTRGEKHGMRGLLGWMRFEGPLGPFLPWLRSAEIVHLGKQTSFGLGRVEVRVR